MRPQARARRPSAAPGASEPANPTHIIMPGNRARRYPAFPMVGVGGVVFRDSRALLIRRGSEPLLGEWSIPGGLLEVGETLEQGVARELAEETGLEVRVLELIEVFERVYEGDDAAAGGGLARKGPKYHFVIV